MNELEVKKPLSLVESPKDADAYAAVLKELGMPAAAKRLEVMKRLAIAYAKYGHVSVEVINKFQEKLRAQTEMKMPHGGYRYDILAFTPLGQYGRIPPPHALSALRAAVKDGLFDRFEVADIRSKEEVPDPIIFGLIDGCNDRFFIAQWDDDVTIEEIVGAT